MRIKIILTIPLLGLAFCLTPRILPAQGAAALPDQENVPQAGKCKRIAPEEREKLIKEGLDPLKLGYCPEHAAGTSHSSANADDSILSPSGISDSIPAIMAFTDQLGEELKKSAENTDTGGNWFDGSRPSWSSTALIGIGQSRDGRWTGTAGALGRYGYPLGGNRNAYGDVGIELGVLATKSGDSSILIDKQVVDYNQDDTWELVKNTYSNVSGINLFQFAGVGYQAPRLFERLTLEVGARLGLGWDDPRTKTVEEKVERQWTNHCQGAGTDGCWTERSLGQTTVAAGPGSTWSGLFATAYGAAVMKVSDQVNLRIEADRFIGGGENMNGTYNFLLGAGYNFK